MRQQQQQEESTPQATGFWKRSGWHRTVSTPIVTSETVPTTENATATQIAELEQAILQRKRNLRVSSFATSGALMAMVAWNLVMAFGLNIYGVDQISQLIATFEVFTTAFLGFSAVSVFALLRGTRRLRQVTEALADTDDLSAVGPLIEALRFPGHAHNSAATTLARLLPRLNAQDTVRLNAEQCACLLKALRASANPRSLACYNPHFAVTLLYVLEKMQDSKALPLISRLARSKANTPAQENIRWAAQECLSVLSGHTVSSNRLLAADSEIREESEGMETGSSHVSPAAVETLMTQFHQAARTYKRHQFISSAGAVIGSMGVLTMLGLSAMLQKDPSAGWAMFLYVMMMAGILGMQYSASRTRGTVSALAETDNLRVIGPLTDALEISDGWLLRMAMAALTRLLPHLQASDAALLNEAQRAILCRWLDRWAMDKRDKKKNECAISILKALAQVGDAQAVPSVQRLANFDAKTSAQISVRDEARACLPFLEVRADQQRASQTLLRAAPASSEPSEVLLRPAAGTTTTDPQTLLRPGHSLDTAE